MKKPNFADSNIFGDYSLGIESRDVRGISNSIKEGLSRFENKDLKPIPNSLQYDLKK